MVMKIYLKAILATVLVGGIFAGLFYKWKEKTFKSIGQEKVQAIDDWEKNGLPNFVGNKLDGSELELKSFSDKIVIVSFWASWCSPCLEEFPSMIRLVEEMNGKVQLLAVSEDSDKEEIEAFLKAFPKARNPNIHVLWDKERKIGTMYGADRLPESYLTGTNLKLIRKVTGAVDWSSSTAIEFIKGIK
jgi:thiol-disulfide isomerase/thioredoxin